VRRPEARDMTDSAGESDRVPSPPNWSLVPGNWHLAPNARLCLSMSLSLFARRHRQTCPHLCSRLRRHVCRSSYLYLNLDLCLDLYRSLSRELFPML
jgi:hypothetical protein